MINWHLRWVVMTVLAVLMWVACDDNADGGEARNTTDTETSDTSDTSDRSDASDSAEPTDTTVASDTFDSACEWEDYIIPVGSSITYDLPPCLGCNNYMMVYCDIDDAGELAALPMPSDCLCGIESCHIQALQTEIYLDSVYLDDTQCCRCTAIESETSAYRGEVECVEGACSTSGATCEYDSQSYAVGEFAPGFPCDTAVNNCLCEEVDGAASWKCASCTNANIPNENDAVEIAGHCCTHQKFGSPAFNSSYIQCTPGTCPQK